MAMWNRRAETLSGTELDKVRDSRLAKTLRRAWTSERYRAILAKGGVSFVDGVSSIADIVRLPFVTADDLASPDSPFPLLCVGYRDILEVHRGSGKPFATPYTKGDLLVWAECVARAFSAAGASQGDRASMPDGEGFFTGDSFVYDYHYMWDHNFDLGDVALARILVDDIANLKALGLDVFPTDSVEQAKSTLHALAKEDYAVVYLTETLGAEMSAEMSWYKDQLKPAIILIPGREGSLGIGKANIQKAIERAVGADIF